MARKKQDTLVLFPEVMDITRKFSDEKFGILMRAVFSYRFSGEEYQGDDPAIEVAFLSIAGQIDRYVGYCETLSRNARSSKVQQKPAKGGADGHQEANEPSMSKSKSMSCPNPFPDLDINSSEKPNLLQNEIRCSFQAASPQLATTTTTDLSIPSSLEEVRAYVEDQGLAMDAGRFFDYYTAKGWMLGSNPVKDWKALARNWAKREQERPATATRNPQLAPIPTYEGEMEWTL